MQPLKGSKSTRDAKAVHLQQEAMDMEAKLLDLRRAMELERAKREQMIAGAVEGSLWKNGSSGLLRGNFRAKHAKDAGASPGASPGQSRATSGRSSGRSGVGVSSEAQAQTTTKTVDSSMKARTPPALGANMGDAGVSGSRISGAAQSRSVSHAPMGFGGGSRNADILTVDHEDDNGHVDGMACGTEPENDDLLGGGFSEADSHRSFLEALNEWRNANKAATSEAAPDASASTSRRPASASTTPSAPMECQTETMKPRRPSSAKSMSMFGKLVLNSSSRVAGQAAGGRPSALDAPLTPGGSRPPGLPVAPQMPAGSAAGAESDLEAIEESEEAARAVDPLADPLAMTNGDSIGGSNSIRPSSDNPKVNAAMDMLARLEALEKQNQGLEEEDDDDNEAVEVTSAKGLGLTKATRLPDAIFCPGVDKDADAED